MRRHEVQRSDGQLAGILLLATVRQDAQRGAPQRLVAQREEVSVVNVQRRIISQFQRSDDLESFDVAHSAICALALSLQSNRHFILLACKIKAPMYMAEVCDELAI